MKVLTGRKMEANVTNLEPEQQYEFMVLSQDQNGDGMFSKAFRYYTKRIYFINKIVIFSIVVCNYSIHLCKLSIKFI